MKTRDALYAAVGAPVAVAKTVNARLTEMRSEVEGRTDKFASTAQKRIDEWTLEGRQFVDKVSDGKVVDEITSKVDFDQAREQVTKLRDQLEDMLATWRTSFRPMEEAAGSAARSVASSVETAGDKVEQATDELEKKVATKTTTRPGSRSTASKKAPAKKAPATKASAKKAS